MSESKELLEATIKGLEEKINSLNTDINMKRKELEDINKPEMTGEIFDKIHGLVEDSIHDALGNLNSDDLEKEFGMEYDGRVYLESFSIDEYPLVQAVMDKIDHEFKVIVKNKE
mgnify:CR=1 FL=1